MPCIKCSNGKWKYGEKGKCIYDTLEKCKAAAAAIHAEEDKKDGKSMRDVDRSRKEVSDYSTS